MRDPRNPPAPRYSKNLYFSPAPHRDTPERKSQARACVYRASVIDCNHKAGQASHQEKETKMTVTVTLNDGSQIFPAYDPEHRDGVTKFYADAKDNGEIRDYEIS